MNLREVIFCGLFIGTGLVLPVIFHATGLGGAVFLPMHIPVLLAGLLLDARSGLLVGILAPLISGILTGMPPMSPPILPIMLVELAAYGWTAGWLFNNSNRLFLSLVGAMFFGRIAVGFGAYLATILLGFKVSVWVYISGATATGIPGIIIQLILIPIIVKAWHVFMRRRGGDYCGA